MERHVVAGSRSKVVIVLGICAVFVAIGLFMVSEGEWLGWVVAGFFGPGGIAVIVLTLLRGWPSIVLDEHGFEFTAAFRRSRFAWSDVEEFFVMRMSGAKMIGIAFAPGYRPMARTRRWVQAISGVEGAIPDQYALSPEDLCTLLNQWRERHAAARKPG